jgi:hypothetical protein
MKKEKLMMIAIYLLCFLGGMQIGQFVLYLINRP